MFQAFSFLRTQTYLSFKPISNFTDIWKKKANVIFKPLTISSGDAVFSAVPIKGKYGQKQDYITVIKNGCMLAELIPQTLDQATGRKVIDYNKRVNIALTISNTGQILAISDQVISSKDININIGYTLASDAKKKAFHISKKLADSNFTFNITETINIGSEWKDSSLQVQIPVTDFILFRELCKISLPYMLGWQALNTYDYAERDSQDDRI